MIFRDLLVLAAAVSIFAATVQAKAQFQIIGKKIECSGDSPLVENRSCSFTEQNITTQYWSVDVYFKEDVVIDNLYAILSWYYKTATDTKFKPFMGITNVTTNVCQYLSFGNSMIVDLFLDDLKKSSNLIHQCPFKGHCYVRNLSPNVKRFPAILPQGAYYMWFVFYTKVNEVHQEILSMKLHVDVKTIR